MLYLFFQTFFWILAAFILGLLIGWWFCGRCRCTKKTDANVTNTANLNRANQSTSVKQNVTAKPVKAAATAATATAATTVSDAYKPQGFASKPADSDELKRVKGIGPVIEKTLNGLGVYQFKQIAEFSKDNIAWVENYLAFPGRIGREDWIAQAKDLAEGKETEFSKRVDKGDLDY